MCPLDQFPILFLCKGLHDRFSCLSLRTPDIYRTPLFLPVQATLQNASHYHGIYENATVGYFLSRSVSTSFSNDRHAKNSMFHASVKTSVWSNNKRISRNHAAKLLFCALLLTWFLSCKADQSGAKNGQRPTSSLFFFLQLVIYQICTHRSCSVTFERDYCWL